MNEQVVKSAAAGFFAQLNVRGITDPAVQAQMYKAACYRGNVRALIASDIQEKVAALRQARGR